MGKPDARLKRAQETGDRKQGTVRTKGGLPDGGYPLPERAKRELEARVRFKRASHLAEYIGESGRTRGTETSQYLEEKKSTEIP